MLAAEGPILVVAAHPDDEVLGCGGTIARLAGEGRDITIAIVAEGITSRDATRDTAARAKELTALHETARRAASLLGARRLELFGLPDNRLDSVPLLDIVKRLEALIAELRPAVVFTQHGGDLNIDHRRIFEAVLTATRPIAGHSVKQLLGYEVPSSTEWAFQRIEPAFRPNLFVEIGATLERKLAAMAFYDGEARPFPHPRSAEALTAIARRWGSVAGVAAAEAFDLVRSVS